MICLELFFVFFLVGLFSFGGGYAAIPLIQDSVVGRGWITAEEFFNMVAVAESTPGPVLINTATYVGFKMDGLFGAAVATLGACTPAFILVVLVSSFLRSKQGKQLMKRIMVGIKPVVIGLIFYAAWTVGKEAILTGATATNNLNIFAVVLAGIAFVWMRKCKFSPLWMIAIAAFLGAFLF